MKFGIFYEHQLSRPWSQESEHRLLHESLAQIELADGLGYDYAWEEAVRALIPCFTQESVEFHGRFFDFPARNVIPKPYQKPHPPLWVACSNITTIGNAGQWGMGALGFQFVSPEAARVWVNEYYVNLTRRPLTSMERP